MVISDSSVNALCSVLFDCDSDRDRDDSEETECEGDRMALVYGGTQKGGKLVFTETESVKVTHLERYFYL